MDENDQPVCSICLTPIKYGKPEWLVLALACGHCYHTRCMLHWGKRCPICNYGDNFIDLVTINCELHTDIYHRCFTIKIRRDDNIDMLLRFIQELTGISTKHIKMRSFEVKNNTIDVRSDPPKLDESLQRYYNRRETILNKVLGFAVLYNMTIHFDLSTRVLTKINQNPDHYGFINQIRYHQPVELELESDSDSNSMDEVSQTVQLCECVII